MFGVMFYALLFRDVHYFVPDLHAKYPWLEHLTAPGPVSLREGKLTAALLTQQIGLPDIRQDVFLIERGGLLLTQVGEHGFPSARFTESIYEGLQRLPRTRNVGFAVVFTYGDFATSAVVYEFPPGKTALAYAKELIGEH